MAGKERIEYVHNDLDEEVTAISGSYVITDERRLSYQNKELLILTGFSEFDTSCCGSGGCAFALVYGVIDHWKSSKNENGKDVTTLIPVRGESIQKEIRDLVNQGGRVSQVNFM